MAWKMKMLYLSIIAVCVYMEFSSRINTDNVIEKMALGIISLGALIHLCDAHNYLVETGVLLYLISRILSPRLREYFRYHNERRSDNGNA